MEPEEFGGGAGAVVLDMYGFQSEEVVWVMGRAEVSDGWGVERGALGVYS